MNQSGLTGSALTGSELTGSELTDELQRRGYAVAQRLLAPEDCAQLIELYPEQERFRSRIVMSRHGYGQGEYQYFSYPLPPLVAKLREQIYPQLVPVANSWSEQLRNQLRYPPGHDAFLQKCRCAGQRRPTPLILKYTAGDYNCLHQDLYGQTVFPLQLAVLLSKPETDFTGGEFVLTEQRPRMQSRAQVVPLQQGDAVVFAVHHRPVQGKRGAYRVNMRHGISTLRSGQRYTLGVIFHDAK
jgi:hypothetical protein